MIKVVNKSKHKPTPDDFYIGRGSVLGNPYHSKESDHPQALYKVETTEEAIEGYQEYFRNKFSSTDEGFRRQVQNLIERELNDKDTNLVCYCAPDPCHGNFIKKFVEDAANQIRWSSFM
jgi:hypothetical protein